MKNSKRVPEFQSVNTTADMPPYMRIDPNGYKFVRPIPEDLQPHFGKKNFIKRLGKDLKKAKLALAELVVATNRQLEAAKESRSSSNSVETFLATSRNGRFKEIGYSEDLAGSLSTLWLHGLDADAQARASGDLDEDQFEALEQNTNEMLDMIRRALATGNVDKFHNAIHQLLVCRGYELKATGPEWQKLTYNVLKTFRDGYKILSARQQGEQLDPIHFASLPPALPAAWENSPSEIKVHLLSEIKEKYSEYISKGAVA